MNHESKDITAPRNRRAYSLLIPVDSEHPRHHVSAKEPSCAQARSMPEAASRTSRSARSAEALNGDEHSATMPLVMAAMCDGTSPRYVPRDVLCSVPRHGKVNSRNSDASMARTFECSCTRAAGA